MPTIKNTATLLSNTPGLITKLYKEFSKRYFFEILSSPFSYQLSLSINFDTSSTITINNIPDPKITGIDHHPNVTTHKNQ
jgi:nanoRNase/pAp phosphatase (c-di-AMP/oligoRNAs hydrolase)